MASNDRSTALRVARLGMGMVTAESGMSALQSVLSTTSPATAIAVFAAVPFNWQRFIQRMGSAVPPMFALFADATAVAAAAPTAAPSSLRRTAVPRQLAAPAASVVAPRAATQSAVAGLEQYKQQITAEVHGVANSILGRCVHVSRE